MVGEVFDYSNTTLSIENDIILEMEPIIEEIKTHVSSQGPLSAVEDNSLNTPTDEDTDDNIRDPDCNPSSDESSALKKRRQPSCWGSSTRRAW